MTRDYQVNGETMVYVRGGAHMSGGPIGNLSELGLASESVHITPRFVHYDMKVNDFGPEIPAETLWMLAEAHVRMTLIHYDRDVLSAVVRESMGRGGALNSEGTLVGAGTPMGHGLPLFSSGCHYICMTLASPNIDYPWRFRACYLADRPFELPLGTGTSLLRLNWRVIPYARPRTNQYVDAGTPGGFSLLNVFSDPDNPTSVPSDVRSSGTILWDHVMDANGMTFND